jgi:dTDP-4-dehydrorhamnose reductase
MSIRVLVTGANGQLGKTIEELFACNQNEVDFSFVSKSELDITKKESLEGFFNINHFDYCINCAAYTNVEQAEKTPDIAYLINAEGVKNLAQLCKENNIVLIHVSTDYVFDGEKEEPYTVDDIPNPINEYGKSKLLGEQYIQEILEKYFIVRTSWLYSKKYGNNFYRTILEKIKVKNKLTVTTQQIGCPTDTVNLSKFIFQLIKRDNSNFGLYHFCDSKAMTWYDFAEQVLIENGMLKKIRLVRVHKYLTFAKRPINSVLLNSKIV